MLALLAECRTNRWVFDKVETWSRLNITKVSLQQKEVLKALDCDSVAEEKRLKSILKKAAKVGCSLENFFPWRLKALLRLKQTILFKNGISF